jgi:asparagine synthase (glutamine-hydrolysing)
VETPAGLKTGTYWLPAIGAPRTERSEGEAATELLRILGVVTDEYRRADRGRTAITISGGLDSAVVAAALSQPADVTPIRFTTPELPGDDEDMASAELCNALNLAGGIVVRADRYWPLSTKVLREADLEQPRVLLFAEVWEEAARLAAAQGIGVVLTGVGGDTLFESFSGETLSRSEIWRVLPALGRLRRIVRGDPMAIVGVLRRLLARGLPSGLMRLHRAARASERLPWLRRRTEPLASPSFAERPAERTRKLAIETLQNSPHLVELAERLRPHGIEPIHPFLDHRFVDFVLSLPTDRISRDGETKWIARRALRDRLPREIVARRGKTRPRALHARAFAERETETIRSLFFGDVRSADLGLVEPSQARSGYAAYLQGEPIDPLFFHAITLEQWLRAAFP